MTKDQLLKDLFIMIQADQTGLAKALEKGDRTAAHRFVDGIINSKRDIEDTLNA